MKRGWTLIELILVLVIAGIVLSLGLPSVKRLMDRVAVIRAAGEISSFYQRARHQALLRALPVDITFSADSLLATMNLGFRDSAFAVQAGPSRIGVRLNVTRPTISLYPYGLGRGAANTRLILARGFARETLTTSRLGRIKRW